MAKSTTKAKAAQQDTEGAVNADAQASAAPISAPEGAPAPAPVGEVVTNLPDTNPVGAIIPAGTEIEIIGADLGRDDVTSYLVADPVDHDGIPYRVGDVLALDSDTARILLACGVIEVQR